MGTANSIQAKEISENESDDTTLQKKNISESLDGLSSLKAPEFQIVTQEAYSHPIIEHKNTWKSLVWDTWGHPDKRHVKIIRKLDLTLLLFATVSTFIKYIDKTNLTSAYVSGMLDYFEKKGYELTIQLNWANNGYNIASIVFGYPFGYLMARYSTKWLVISIEVAWIIVTMCFSSIKSPTQMIVLRTLLGAFECGHYPALSFLLGSYYTKEELARRNVLLQSSTALGSMFASYIQSGAYTHLDGKLGREGWSWTFIIDGVISLGVLVPQIIFFPDILSRATPGLVFSEDEIEYLQSRKPESRNEKYNFSLNDIKEVFTTWEVWAFWFFGVSQDIVSLSMVTFIFWIEGWNTIKEGSYSVPQINNFNSILYAVQYLVAIVTGWSSDTFLRGKRWPPIVLAGLISFVVTIILASTPVYPHHRGFRFFLYLNTSWALGTAGLYWAYAQEYFEYNFRLKAIVTGGINIYSFTANCIVNPIWFRTDKQPYVQTGHYISAFFAFWYAAVAALLGWNEYRKSKAISQLS
ncbi:uncharacterized protein PRCAT00004325001 [Priceomyces carsonii]|uniref:uncharacterized protein n=1 Tax=Priceomyces carsonii TaxID=28549 RepID=UPI002ED88BF7|nr:unnamed protein product [Priceomyces carsonii]